MTARKFSLPGPFGGIASARGMLLTGCALALCGAAVIARTVSGAPEADRKLAKEKRRYPWRHAEEDSD